MLLLLLVIAVLSEAVHDVAIEHLGIPFPTIVTQPSWLPYVGSVVRLVALVLFCRTAQPMLDTHSLARAALVVALLTTALSEGLRVPVIDFFLAHGRVGRRWLFALISYLPRLGTGILQGFAAVAIARIFASKPAYGAILAAAVAGFLIRFAFVPVLDQVAALLDALVGVTRPAPLYEPPYGPGMLLIIYVTFLEPSQADGSRGRPVHSADPWRDGKIAVVPGKQLLGSGAARYGVPEHRAVLGGDGGYGGSLWLARVSHAVCGEQRPDRAGNLNE